LLRRDGFDDEPAAGRAVERFDGAIERLGDQFSDRGLVQVRGAVEE
jgi:hypothetical protein